MTSNKKTIRYQQLVKKMRNKTGLSTEKNQKVIDTFIEMLTDTISDGNSVSISKLGTFSYRQRKNVVTRNVTTGDVYQPIDTAFATFSSSPPFKEKIKSKIDGRDLVLDTVEEDSEPTKATPAKSTATLSKQKTTTNTKKSSSTATKKTTTAKKSTSTATKSEPAKKSTSTATKKATTAKKSTSTATKKTPAKRTLKRKSKLIVDED